MLKEVIVQVWNNRDIVKTSILSNKAKEMLCERRGMVKLGCVKYVYFRGEFLS